MPTTLYLIRHGETDYNRRRIVQGRRINSQLNETGRRQAEALARRFASVPVEAFYSSTLRRAEETADIVAAQHPGVPVFRVEDLEEMSWGIFEGQPATEAWDEAYASMRESWERGDYTPRWEGGESILEVQERGVRAVRQIAQRHPGDTVVVVTHGRFLRVILASLLTEIGLDRMDELSHGNTCVNQLAFENDRVEAVLLNCTAHLDEITTELVE